MKKLIQKIGLPIIAAIDRHNVKKMGLQKIPHTKTGLILYRIIPYPGEEMTLSDGTVVHHGDPIVDFHFSNPLVLSGTINGKKLANELELLPLMRQELNAIAEAALAGEMPPFKALYCLSLFGPFVKRLGFELYPAPQTREIDQQMRWMSYLRYFFSPDYSKTQDKHHKKKSAYHVWYSHDGLLALAQKNRETAQAPLDNQTAK